MILSRQVALILPYCRLVTLCQVVAFEDLAPARPCRAKLMAWAKFKGLWKDLGNTQAVVDGIWGKRDKPALSTIVLLTLFMSKARHCQCRTLESKSL